MRLVLAVLMMCFLLPANAEEADNPFAESYQAISKSSADPQIITSPKISQGDNKDADRQAMLEKGYDLLGYSEFESNEIPADLALQHAKTIGADEVLVYSYTAATANSTMKLEKLKESLRKKSTDDSPSKVVISPKVFNYYASFWTKLPTPILGLHVFNREEEKGQGLMVLAVINDSPAYKAGLKKGDRLQRINDISLEKPESLGQAARQYQGQTIEIEYVRDGVLTKTTASLNSRK